MFRKISSLKVMGITFVILTAFFYLYTNPIDLTNPQTERNKSGNAPSKLLEFIDSQSPLIVELDKQSEQLKEVDKELDEFILNADAKAGLSKKEFAARYPGFDISGDSQ